MVKELKAEHGESDLAVALVEGNLQNRIQQQIPKVAPSYFFLDIQPSQIGEFRQTATSTPGVSRVESMPAIRGRITKIKGVPAEKVKINPDVSWVLRRDRAMTYAARMPEGTVLSPRKTKSLPRALRRQPCSASFSWEASPGL